MRAPITHVLGARPNFMKAAPVIRALAALGHDQRVVHTGQHYDERMSEVFFVQLGLPRPDVNLEVGSGSHARQTAEVLVGMEREFTENSPALAVVYGDVNSTVGAALAAAKLGVPLAHVEAGLRSFDDSMPEEINRRLTDQLCALLFVTSPEAIGHLAREGRPADAVHLVGNPMIDTLLANLDRFDTAAARDRARAAGQVRGRDLAPAGQRGRPGGRGRPGRRRCTRSRTSSTWSSRCTRAAAPRWRRPGSRDAPAAARRSTRSATSSSCRWSAARAAVITDSGGVQEETTLLRRALPDPAAEHRAARSPSPAAATAWSPGTSWPRPCSRRATTGRTRASCRRCGTATAGPRIARVITTWLDAA